jgi:hypothetical protein
MEVRSRIKSEEMLLVEDMNTRQEGRKSCGH